MPTLSGTLERIVFRNQETHYTVARLRLNDSGRLFRDDLVTLVGTLPGVSVGELIEATGEWELHPTHGRHLRVTTFATHTPVTPAGLKRYLGSGVIKGIGPKTAERIVEQFGEQTLAIIELEPERLTEVPGVSRQKLKLIVEVRSDRIPGLGRRAAAGAGPTTRGVGLSIDDALCGIAVFLAHRCS